MDWSFLGRGLVIGFSIAAPVGPIGVLCIRRTLSDGRAAGFVSGLGAATADAVYGSIAGFGLTAISGVLVGGQARLRLVGGLFLCYLGVRTLRSRSVEGGAPGGAVLPARGLAGAYATTFVLTLTNPMTIISFAAIFAGLGIAAARDYGSAALLVAGVFTGSALWWFILSGIASSVRGRMRPGSLRWVSLAAGVIITSFGILALLSLR
ncbi:MAG TPA: LysE family transporter [bacterium]|nr:LysE family transporter [bacterium]